MHIKPLAVAAIALAGIAAPITIGASTAHADTPGPLENYTCVSNVAITGPNSNKVGVGSNGVLYDYYGADSDWEVCYGQLDGYLYLKDQSATNGWVAIGSTDSAGIGATGPGLHEQFKLNSEACGNGQPYGYVDYVNSYSGKPYWQDNAAPYYEVDGGSIATEFYFFSALPAPYNC